MDPHFDPGGAPQAGPGANAAAHGTSSAQPVPNPRLKVHKTPSEDEAMQAAGQHQSYPPKLSTAAHEARGGAQVPEQPSGSMKPVFSSDSLMAMAAQDAFSGLGSTSAGMPAYPGIPPPRMAPAALGNASPSSAFAEDPSPPASLLTAGNAAQAYASLPQLKM